MYSRPSRPPALLCTTDKSSDSILIVEPGPYMPDFHWVNRPWRPYNESARHYQPPMLMMNMTTTPQPALDGRRGTIEAGYGVGGGSLVNGQLLNRGSAADYNAWEELGNPGWGWDGLFPYFRKSVTFHRPGQWLQDTFNVTWDDEAYGGHGPVHASYPAWAWPQQMLQARGWAELGLKRTREGAGGDATGIFWVPRTQDPHNETRSYSGNAHLLPALARGKTQLLSDFSVRRLALSNQSSIQADGVIIDQNNSADGVPAAQRLILARKEVILAANLYSCIILQRSGIGSREILEAAGINVTVDLPGYVAGDERNIVTRPRTGCLLALTEETQGRCQLPGPSHHNAGFLIQQRLPALSLEPVCRFWSC
jgi:choline dehydrogenase-like flavoprotein